jgi:hypothetical protein
VRAQEGGAAALELGDIGQQGLGVRACRGEFREAEELTGPGKKRGKFTRKRR